MPRKSKKELGLPDGRVSNPRNRNTLDKARKDGKTGQNGELVTDMEELFLINYFKHWNATKAAVDAGYEKRHAGQTAWTIMQRPKIKEAIEAERERRRQDYRKEHEALTEFYLAALHSDIGDFVDEDGNLRKVTELDGLNRMLISEITVGRKGTTVKLFSKQSAADMLNKHVGYYEQDNKQKHQEGVAIYLPDNGRDDTDLADSKESSTK